MSDLPAEIGPTTEAIIKETRRITPETRTRCGTW